MAEIKLEFSLKRIAMISIAQVFWKLPDIIYKIKKFNIQKDEFLLMKEKLRYCTEFQPVKNLSNYNYIWEEVIDCVLEKTRKLFLPSKLKEDLQKTIIFMGQKIFYFYDEFREPYEPGNSFREYFRCQKCITAARTEDFYRFSSSGTLLFQCSRLHSKPVPPKYFKIFHLLHFKTKYKEKFQEFLDDVVSSCDVETIEKYEKDIIAFLKTLIGPGLSFNTKNEKPLNIICLWNLMKPERAWKEKFFHSHKNGYTLLPGKYLSKSKKFYLPLELMPQMCLKSNPMVFKYLAAKLRSLEDPSLFSRMVQILMAYDQALLVNNRLHFFPGNYYIEDKIIKVLSFMSPDEASDFMQKNLNNLFMAFLPVWPHQEIVPKILDLCEEKNFHLDSTFLLRLITICIAIENESKYKVRKKFYLEVFERVWSMTKSEKIKLTVFVKKTARLMFDDSDNPILKLILKDKDFKKCANLPYHRHIHAVLRDKWRKLLKKENFAIVKDFVNGLVFLEEEFEDFLDSYADLKSEERTFVYNNFFVY